MSKVNLDYVFSAPLMIRLVPAKKFDNLEYLKVRTNIIIDCVQVIKNNINKRYDYLNLDFGLLFNGFMEKRFAEFYLDERYGFKNIYSDSGGLQVITQGKILDDEMKLSVYQTQDCTDIAFCFDEIPIEKVSEFVDDNTRTSIVNKSFNHMKFEECAYKTAQNVKTQLNTLKNAKVSYIIQGNTFKDMIRWFEIGVEVLGDKIHDLHGIAVSGACMGNGELETCDMIFAAKFIFDKYEKLQKRLHLLGVGSSSRLVPLMLLAKSGFLDNIQISSDSSSHSMSFMMGNYVTFNNTITKEQSYKLFIEEIWEVLKPYCTNHNIDDLVNYISNNDRYFGVMEDNCYHDKSHDYHSIIGTICPLYNIWSVNRLFYEIDVQLKQPSHINLLSQVTNCDDYLKWRSQNYSNVLSKRIKRKRPTFFNMG